ncbi:hypothetical protein EDD90_6354 [Streptomyces sp. Ag109_O5-1]|nr:hypothetical protein EDD90_6354 [Streptomyces sp. Ag109_O5-1]
MSVCVREDGRESRLGAVSVKALAERGDRVVWQVEERGAHVGVHIEEVAAGGVESRERAQFDGRRRPWTLEETLAFLEAAAAGVAPRVIMEILGHSQISITMDVYTHVVHDTRREAISHMDRLLKRRRPAA